MFGGEFALPFRLSKLGDTWEWDRASWSLAHQGAPSRRKRPAMARQRGGGVVMFSGTASSTPSDTWTWEHGSWQYRTSAGPSGRSMHAMAYDPVRQRTVLFGGRGLPRETWEPPRHRMGSSRGPGTCPRHT